MIDLARIGYARVSDKSQNLARQKELLSDCKKIFVDKISGATSNRPGLIEMLNYIRDEDIVVVTEVARFGRDYKELRENIHKVNRKGATLEILNLPATTGVKDKTLRLLMNNLILELEMYRAEVERRDIRERQQQGIEIAKKQGHFKGRKPLFKENDPKLQHAFNLYLSGKYTVKELEHITGISVATFRRYRKKYGIEKQ